MDSNAAPMPDNQLSTDLAEAVRLLREGDAMPWPNLTEWHYYRERVRAFLSRQGEQTK